MSSQTGESKSICSPILSFFLSCKRRVFLFSDQKRERRGDCNLFNVFLSSPLTLCVLEVLNHAKTEWVVHPSGKFFPFPPMPWCHDDGWSSSVFGFFWKKRKFSSVGLITMWVVNAPNTKLPTLSYGKRKMSEWGVNLFVLFSLNFDNHSINLDGLSTTTETKLLTTLESNRPVLTRSDELEKSDGCQGGALSSAKNAW